MQSISSVLQLVGLGCVIVGAAIEFGVSGAVGASGAAAVFVGLALERD